MIVNEYGYCVVSRFSLIYTHQQRPAFTKRNVFLRDEYRCQYCKNRFFTRDLSLDHVVPRCQGGRLTWCAVCVVFLLCLNNRTLTITFVHTYRENAVTCCNKCNCKKGSLNVKHLHRVGMKLSREPFVPTQYELASIASRMLPSQVHPTWEPYLARPEVSNDDNEESFVLEKEEQELFLDEV